MSTVDFHLGAHRAVQDNGGGGRRKQQRVWQRGSFRTRCRSEPPNSPLLKLISARRSKRF